MRMYIPFGDFYDDGHGKYKRVLIDAPSVKHLIDAQTKIKAKYGKYFFQSFAEEYDEPYLSPTIWQALKDTDFPIEEWEERGDEYGHTWNDSDFNPYVSLDFVIEAFFWLLNAYGAQVMQIPEDIPTICGAEHDGYFETVGYGCFC